jgi:hypothetical protein
LKIITKDNTIRTVVRITMLMFILLTSSSAALSSTNDGYWSLVKTEEWSDITYPVSYSGGEGAITITKVIVGEYKGSDGIRTVLLSWTPIPKTLTPGKTLNATLRGTSIDLKTDTHIFQSIVGRFDNFGMPHGATSGSKYIGVEIGDYDSAGTTKFVDGAWEIPSYGSYDSSNTNKMQFRVSAGSGGAMVDYTYIYEWVPKSVVTSSPTTTVGSKLMKDTWNKGLVNNNAQCRPGFTISESHVITYINTYHWNNGQGVKLPGAITLFNLDDGQSYGTWPAEGEPDMNGVPNVVWVVRPDIEIPAGRYEIADSDNPTWSNNQGSNNCGFSKVEGIEGTHRTVLPAPARTIAPSTPARTRVTPASVATATPNVGIIAVISIVLIVYTLRRKR